MSGTREKNVNLRSWWEAAGWIVLIVLLWGTDLLAKLSVRNQTGFGADTFRLVSEQVTSAIAVLVMVPFLVHWLKLFPLKIGAWPRTVVGHTAGSVIFAFGHFVLMIMLRAPWYSFNGRNYIWREPFVTNLVVEYQKDIKIYIGFMVLIAVYQHYRRSKTGVTQARADRLIVQTGSGDAVLRFDQIDYIEAARNYVAVHADGSEYLIRDTMSNVVRRLSAGPFAQTHRSFIVNVDKVSEIRSMDSRQRVLLHGGKEVPLSRSYRDNFTRAITGDAEPL